MAVDVIDKIKPKNNGSFAVADAVDIEVSEGVRLPEALAGKADAADLTELTTTVGQKADASTVTASVAELQGEIDQIVISAGAEDVVAPEVAAARVDVQGVSHNTLKARIDDGESKTIKNESERDKYYIWTNRYIKTFPLVTGSGHSSMADRLTVDIKAGDTVVVSLSNDAASNHSVAVLATDSGGNNKNLGSTTLSGNLRIAATESYSSLGIYLENGDATGTATYTVEVYRDEQKKALMLTKSDLTVGSLQTQTMKAAATITSAYCYLHKIPLSPNMKLKVIVPAMEGITYKYRYGRYNEDGTYRNQITLTESDTVTQDATGYYVSVGVYAINVSDGEDHPGIMDEYPDTAQFKLEFQNDYENQFIPLNYYDDIVSLKTGAIDTAAEITELTADIEAIDNEIEGARQFVPIDYSVYITHGYYLSATTGRDIEQSGIDYATIPCRAGDKFIVDFGGAAAATPLFSAGANKIATEIFVPGNTQPPDPVQVTITSGVLLCLNYLNSRKMPIVKRYQLGSDDSDDGIIGLNKGFEDYAVQAMRPINLSSNAYLSNTQPFSLMHFSDIHGDSGELQRLKEFYTKYKEYFDGAICTGDLVQLRFSNDFEYFDWTSVLLAIGNHDVLADETGWDWSNRATQAQQYAKFFEDRIADWECNYTEDCTYYFKDYAAKKIRLIVLNCMLTGTDDTLQLEWFENVLADARTSDLHVVVANHYPVRNFTKLACNFTTIDKTFNNEAAVNMDAYQEAISYHKSRGGKFICWIAGHTHYDLIGYNSDYPDQYCICIDALNRSQGNQYSDTQRTNSTKCQDLANMFVIDTTSSVVKLVRIGADKDHYLRSKQSITLNYTTGAVVASN